MTQEVKPGKRFAFTVNNYNDQDVTHVTQFATEVQYLIYGKEVGDNGTPHLQGFVILNVTARLSKLKKAIPRAHWENAKKCNAANVNYCKKDKDFTEFGELPQSKGQAQVDIWNSVRRAAEQGKFDEIPDNIYIRYKRTLHEIHQESFGDQPDLEAPCGIWIVGQAGSGKTKYVRTTYPKETLFKKEHTEWWCGYKGQPNVVLEDLGREKADVLATHLKLWADSWSFAAQRKGKQAIDIRPKTFIVTSQYRIEELYYDGETREALQRRFKIIEVRSGGQVFSEQQ